MRNEELWKMLDEEVSTNRLANYLKNEYPQTVAVILANLSQKTVAAMLDSLPENFGMEVVMRVLRMEDVDMEVLRIIEETIQEDFVNKVFVLGNPHKFMAGALDIMSESDRIIDGLEERNRESADKIKGYML